MKNFDKRNKRRSNISSIGGCHYHLVVGNDQTILKVFSWSDLCIDAFVTGPSAFFAVGIVAIFILGEDIGFID